MKTRMTIRNRIRKQYVRLQCRLGWAIDISTVSRNPASSLLSNFTPFRFTFREKDFTSIESLLQGLKAKDIDKQNSIFSKVGKAAWRQGRKCKWWKEQRLYWQGHPMERMSAEYRNFIREVFYALAENTDYRQVLLSTGRKTLYHTIGKSDPTKTILTEEEFCTILTEIRTKLQTEK